MEKAKMRKHNMKLYPSYYTLSYDFLFFYTINVLFLIQVQHFNPATIVLVDSFYALFSFLFQIPANAIIEKTSRKKAIILGNIINCLYLIIFMLSKNVVTLIIAEMFCSFGFALKDIAAPSLLNNSIPATLKKSKIFSKISGKGLSNYYILNSISIIISGFLFNINGYIPIILSLLIVFIAFILSTCFIEPLEFPEETKKLKKPKKQISTKDGFKFILKSGRLKSLILFGALFSGLHSLLANVEVSMVEKLPISPTIIGILFASLEIISGLSSKKQNKFHNSLKNKTLSVLGISLSLACIISTIGFFLNLPLLLTLLIIAISFAINHSSIGLYYVLISKYLSNFTNEQIDSKIFAAHQLLNGLSKVILGIITSIILGFLAPFETMFIIGIASLILFTLIIFYSRNKLGLKPSEYDQSELQYSIIKNFR